MANLRYIDRAFTEFSKRIEDIRVCLANDGIRENLSESKSNYAKLVCFARSSIYIYLASAMEMFLEQLHDGILLEVERRGIQSKNCNPIFFMFSRISQFDALKDVRGLKMWEKRKEVFGQNSSRSPITFPVKSVPLDGRTIRDEHLLAIWSLYDFGGSHLPGHSHKLALSDVAENRNAIAHGRADPVSKGYSLNWQDLENLADKYFEIGEHLYDSCNDFFQNKKHLKNS